jgi:Uma2 family endonuclease
MALSMAEMPPLLLHSTASLREMSDEEFFEFCRVNSELRIERTAEGDLIIMSPTGGDTGNRNFNLTVMFGAWVDADGTGVGFDSSTGFTLPNGAMRSPDLAWVPQPRWDALSKEQRAKFPPLCPDFVVELRSPSDDLETLQEKMEEYLANGTLLGWLIDPHEKKVYVYRPAEEVRCLEAPQQVSGDPLLPGFVLDLRKVWG